MMCMCGHVFNKEFISLTMITHYTRIEMFS